MKMTTLKEEQDLTEFTEKAIEWFKFHTEGKTYTRGHISPECLFAVRWGHGNDCVMVFRLGDMEPVVYQNCINNTLDVSQAPVMMNVPDNFDDDIPF